MGTELQDQEIKKHKNPDDLQQMMSTSFTGTKTIPIDTATTDRQFQIYQEDYLKKELEKLKKENYRSDLNKQIKEKKFKNEYDQIIIDQKSLVTSGAMLRNVGGPLMNPDGQVKENLERFVDSEVKNLQRIASKM